MKRNIIILGVFCSFATSSLRAGNCETVYYHISLDPAVAAMGSIDSVAKKVGSYAALAKRDESDRKVLVNDPTVPAPDKAKAILWLDSNIRAARCHAAVGR